MKTKKLYPILPLSYEEVYKRKELESSLKLSFVIGVIALFCWLALGFVMFLNQGNELVVKVWASTVGVCVMIFLAYYLREVHNL